MELQNKIGRDIATALIRESRRLTNDNKTLVAILESTDLYEYYLNDPDYHFGNGDTTFSRLPRDRESAKLILPIEIYELWNTGTISKDERDNLTAMMEASDADFVVAEELINQFRNKRIRRHKYGNY